MKIFKEEVAGSDKIRILFAVGIEEIKLINGILKKTMAGWPIGEDWKPDANRLRSIIKELEKFLKRWNGNKKR